MSSAQVDLGIRTDDPVDIMPIFELWSAQKRGAI